MTHYLKFAILQGIVLTLIAALFISGVAQPYVHKEALYVIGGLSSVYLYGLAKVALRQWGNAAFASEALVRCGIAALQITLALAIAMMAAVEGKAYLSILGQGIIVSAFCVITSLLLDGMSHFLGDTDETA